MSGVELCLLGDVRLMVGGHAVDIGPARQRTLLAALAVDAGQRVPMDTLIDRIWGDAPPSAAREGVYAYAARLRQVFSRAGLTSPPLRPGSGGYVLEFDAERVDLLRFQRLVAGARTDRDGDDSRAAALDRALGLCRGPALADLSGPWAARTRELLEQQRLDAVLLWAALQTRQGRAGVVVGPLRELVGQHPLVEPLAARLIEALALDRRPAEALAHYATTRETLAAALGIEPGAELRRLHQAVLAGDLDGGPGPAGPAPLGPAPAGPAPAALPAAGHRPAQLPRDIGGFVGRRAQLAALDAALAGAGREPAATVISTISGTAGVGKTALAVHWAHLVRARFPDGQLYLDLRGFGPGRRVVAPAEAIRGLLHGLGVPATRMPPDLDAQAALYRSVLADRRMLVLLDNARDAEQVRPLLPGAPGSLVVVTSRDRLSPLVADGAYPVDLDLLTAAEARAVLVRRLGAERVAAEPAAAEQVIVRCARLPLALTIAAARVLQSGFPLATVAAELAEAADRLEALAAGHPVGEVRAAFSWSYDALTPAAARMFRLIGPLPGPDIGAAAAASIADRSRPDAQRLLAELARASLVVEHAPGRYTCHDLMRAYAADLSRAVDPEPERRAAIGRLLDFYARTACAADRLVKPHRDLPALAAAAAGPAPVPGGEVPGGEVPGGEVPGGEVPGGAPAEVFAGPEDAMAWLDAEHTALLHALQQAIDSGFDAAAWRLAWALDTVLFRRGHWHDIATAWRVAELAADRLGDIDAQVFARRRLGYGYTLTGRYADADVQYRRALDHYVRTGELVGQAFTHHNMATLRNQEGRRDELLQHAEQALALFRAAGHDRGCALTLIQISWHYALSGKHSEALVPCRQALAVLQRLGDRDTEAHTWDILGYAHHHLGDHAQAADSYQHALDLFNDAGDRYNQADTLSRVGDTWYTAGDPAAARAAWRQALDILTELDRPEAAEVRAKLGTT
jgi:DNA-binding SARP family transcriptional activator/tetratricopeptide (TPR) repeat protein